MISWSQIIKARHSTGEHLLFLDYPINTLAHKHTHFLHWNNTIIVKTTIEDFKAKPASQPANRSISLSISIIYAKLESRVSQLFYLAMEWLKRILTRKISLFTSLPKRCWIQHWWLCKIEFVVFLREQSS